jgi:hypothetical protein
MKAYEALPSYQQRKLRRVLTHMCSPHHDALYLLLCGPGNGVDLPYDLTVSVHERNKYHEPVDIIVSAKISRKETIALHVVGVANIREIKDRSLKEGLEYLGFLDSYVHTW